MSLWNYHHHHRRYQVPAEHPKVGKSQLTSSKTVPDHPPSWTGLGLDLPSAKPVTKSQSRAPAGLGSPKLGSSAAHEPFATQRGKFSSLQSRAELCTQEPRPSPPLRLACKQPRAFDFAFLSVSKHKIVKRGQKHPIKSTEHQKSGQRVTVQLRKPRLY